MGAIGLIIWREWKRILTLPVHYWVLLVIPPLLFFFYAFIYEKQEARHLPVAIWDEDHSSVSRQFTFLLSETETVRLTRSVNSEEELQTLIQKGEILGAVHFPRDMEADIKTRRPVYVTLYTNAASMVPAKLVYKTAAQVIITAGSGVILQKFVQTGMKEEKALALVQPIRLSSYTLYNPTYNYQEYLVPGLITVALQMIIIMVSVLMLNYEWKTGTMEELVLLAGGSASNVIIGKTVAHLVAAWVNFVLVAAVIFPIFGIGMEAATGKFFLLYTLLVLACLGFGQLVSALFADAMLASDIALFYTSPAFVFSGFTFPRWAMPWYDQYYANLMPYTPFLDGFFKVYYMDLPLRYAGAEMGRLLIFPLVTFPLAIVFFQRQMQKIKYAKSH